MVAADQPAVTNYQHSLHNYRRPPAIVRMAELPESLDFLYGDSSFPAGSGPGSYRFVSSGSGNGDGQKPGAGKEPPKLLEYNERPFILGPDGKPVDINGDNAPDPVGIIIGDSKEPGSVISRSVFWKAGGSIPCAMIDLIYPDGSVLVYRVDLDMAYRDLLSEYRMTHGGKDPPRLDLTPKLGFDISPRTLDNGDVIYIAAAREPERTLILTYIDPAEPKGTSPIHAITQIKVQTIESEDGLSMNLELPVAPYKSPPDNGGPGTVSGPVRRAGL